MRSNVNVTSHKKMLKVLVKDGMKAFMDYIPPPSLNIVQNFF